MLAYVWLQEKNIHHQREFLLALDAPRVYLYADAGNPKGQACCSDWVHDE